MCLSRAEQQHLGCAAFGNWSASPLHQPAVLGVRCRALQYEHRCDAVAQQVDELWEQGRGRRGEGGWEQRTRTARRRVGEERGEARRVRQVSGALVWSKVLVVQRRP